MPPRKLPARPYTTFSLTDAQWVIAREHGYESWPKFAKHLGDAIDGPGGGNTVTVIESQLEITTAVWDVESGTCLHVLEGHSVGVVKAVWSSSGHRVFSCDWNGGIRTWDLPGSD